MPGRGFRCRLAFAATALACSVALFTPAVAGAAIEPPWCGNPEPDAASQLPDFPHIPYYAIGCTLDSLRDRSDGRMTVEVVGRSALGRPMYGVTINALDTVARRQAFHNWQEVRRLALDDPARAQELVRLAGGAIKAPVFVQGGIHGNESEGVDAIMQIIERLATSAPGEDPVVDRLLDRLVLVFNVVQNPDGRVAGTRANGNGFDLNRDYLTQSQPETIASIDLMKKWLPPEVLDLHGYVNPTLVEATTKPHNPSIEYDLWLKWNQSRIDANEAALAAEGYDITRPINDWCPEGDAPNAGTGLCDDGLPGGPDRAEGWDDWGPFYTAMYAQHLGLDSSTVEMCRQSCGGRDDSRRVQYLVTWSTFEYVAGRRAEMIDDALEIYRRGVNGAEQQSGRGASVTPRR